MQNMTQEVEDMKEWKFLKQIIIEEEGRAISAELDGEYEELDILMMIAGTDTNKTFNNKNAILTAYSQDNTNRTYGYITDIAANKDVFRGAHIRMMNKPYFNFEYGIINYINGTELNNYSAGKYLYIPGFTYNRAFESKINSIKFEMQQCYCGTGSSMIIYGR